MHDTLIKESEVAQKNLYIKTYGCQMNVYDSERMEDLLKQSGYKVSENMDEADMIILNTCHIREKAAEKMYSELGRIKKLKDQKNNKLIIAVAGCVSQAEGSEIFTRAPYVDIVVGPQSYHNLPDMVLKIARDFNKKDGAKHLIELDFIEEEKFDKLPEVDINKKGGSAFVSVQEGCDKFCTFCVVPYTRGAEFSRPLEKVYREVLTLAQNGVKEIHLLGQNVNAYHGVDLDGNQISLASLIERIERIKGVERIRYTTSHPIDMTDELINLHGSSEKLMPFLHLPIQSGSDKILKAMNRKHNREFYLKIIEKIKKQRPDIALSSDFIVGFPGETDQDFEDTLNLVKEVEYAQCYSFKYSKRPGTPASTMPQVEEEVAKERLMILQQELQKQQLEFNKKFIGKELNVLFEKIGSKDTQILGKSEYMQSVHLETNCAQDLLNKTSKVIVKSAGLVSLSAEVI